MRRILLSAIASTAVALAFPGMASAHHSARHHARHASSHRRHHSHVRLLTFVARKAPTPAGTSSTTTPTTTSSSEEVAGTVTSFTGGALTITLNDGTTVSGKVTEKTELECHSATTEESSGGDGGDHEDGGPGPSTTWHSHDGGSMGEDMGGGDHGSTGGDDDEASQQSSCTTAALVPGAKLHEAELSVSSQGSVWEKLDLIQ